MKAAKFLAIIQILFLVTVLFFSIGHPNPTVKGQVLPNGNISVKIRSINGITSESTPESANFSLHYVLQKNFNFPNMNTASPVTPMIGEGALIFPLQGQKPYNVSVYDSLGNQDPFAVEIKNDTIMNTPFTVNAPQNSNFSIYLAFDTVVNIFFDNNTTAYLFGAILPPNFGSYDNFTINFPPNFSIINDNANDFSMQRDQSFSLSWNIVKGKETDSIVSFLPFSIEILQSEDLTIDLQSIFPTKSSHISTYSSVFQSVAEFDGSKLKPLFQIPILFPPSIFSKINITDVQDGQGELMPTLPLSDNANSTGGFYFLNSTQNTLIVYPHNEPVGTEYYNYKITIEFEYTINGGQEATFFPYEYQEQIVGVKPNGPNWDFSNAKLPTKYLLPAGTVNVRADGNPFINTVDGRPEVYWSNLPQESTIFTIKFDVSSLYQFFWISVFSIICLFVLVVFSIFDNPKRRYHIINPIEFVIGILVYNTISFLNLGAILNWTIYFWVGEIIVGCISSGIVIKKTWFPNKSLIIKTPKQNSNFQSSKLKPKNNMVSPLSPRRIEKIICKVGAKCSISGCTEKVGLEVYYIIPREESGTNKESNLVVLCRKHKILAEKRIISRERLETYSVENMKKHYR